MCGEHDNYTTVNTVPSGYRDLGSPVSGGVRVRDNLKPYHLLSAERAYFSDMDHGHGQGQGQPKPTYKNCHQVDVFTLESYDLYRCLGTVAGSAVYVVLI